LIIQLPVRANGITACQQPVAEGGNRGQYLIGFLSFGTIGSGDPLDASADRYRNAG